MQSIYELIKQQPEFFAWVFGLVNVLWGVFIYFNKKRHSKDLVELKQSLDLDLERRRKVFEMKATHYESYFQRIDTFHRNHQNDYQQVFTPIFNEFMSRYLKAEDIGDKAESTNATIWFGEQISKITTDGFQEYLVLENESNTLKLTASDKVASLLDELKKLQHATFELSSEFMNKMVEITINGNQELANSFTEQLTDLGTKAKEKSEQLREEMRKDLGEI